MSEVLPPSILPSQAAVEQFVRRQVGDPAQHGWRVGMRLRFGYVPSEQWYQAVVDRLVTGKTRWIDVGGGKGVFPHNQRLSAELSRRCALLVGVDPSEHIEQNELVHRGVRSTIEEFRSDETFDLATLRMVAEHIDQPEAAVASLARLIEPGGHVVIYTPHRWSPVSIAAALIPNRWHHHFTGFLWSTRPEDVFPTRFRMNTRGRLRDLFAQKGFSEAAFAYLASCSVLQRFRLGYPVELAAWRAIRALGLPYPESDLLGVYRKER